MENMKKQALDFGAYIDDLKEISDVNLEGKEKLVTQGYRLLCKSRADSNRSNSKRLPVEGEKEFRGRGVHYCAHATVPCTLMPTFLWWEEESPRRKKLFF